MIVLSVFHIHRQITDYGGWRIDSTTVFMMLICKYSSFAYAYEDGMEGKKLSKEQDEFKLTKLPSFFEYICYIQFLPTSIMGPSLEYK
jgi:lysophospholipid acyltransferase